MLAAIMKEEFGSALITEGGDARPTLPSPEELKYKILFKVSLRIYAGRDVTLADVSLD